MNKRIINIKCIEKWKYIYINNEKTKFKVSNFGRIKNSETNKIKKLQDNKKGYLIVNIYFKGKQYSPKVHRLVAKAFIPNPKNKPEVNHKDGNKLNNKVSNLEWVTRKENIRHSWDNNLRKPKIGEECNFNVYSESLIISICELLEKGYSNKEILLELNMKNNKKHLNLINDLKRRKIWKHITKKYKWSDKSRVKKYPESLIISICELLEKGYSNKEILLELNMKNNKKVKSLISAIQHKTCWKNISNKYKF